MDMRRLGGPGERGEPVGGGKTGRFSRLEGECGDGIGIILASIHCVLPFRAAHPLRKYVANNLAFARWPGTQGNI